MNGSSRQTSVTYPDGTTQVTYGFGSTGSIDNSISRTDSVSLSDGTGTVATYKYLGLSAVANETLVQPGITETIGLDYFGNTSNVTWKQGGTLQANNTVSGGTSLVNLGYGYDFVGDMLYRDDEVADPAGGTSKNLDQIYIYDKLHRLTGYKQGTLATFGLSPTMSNTTASPSWSLDSEGNRYDTIYGTSYNPAGETANDATSGNTSTIDFGSSESVSVTYDSWGRVAQVVYSPSTGGPNGAATWSYYQYDALGRRIQTTNLPAGGGLATGTYTYYAGANPIVVFAQADFTQPLSSSNSTVMERYVWSPTDGRMILRDAVVSTFNAYTGLAITGNISSTIQRLYPMADAQGSIVAVVNPSGTVLERYTYNVDGSPYARQADFTLYSGADSASVLGWNWLYQGQQWMQTHKDTLSTPAQGLYASSSGVWYDPVHARVLQPNLSSYGDPHTNPYQLSTLETVGTWAPTIVGIGAGIASAAILGPGGVWVGTAAAGALSVGASVGVTSYIAGNSAGTVIRDTAIGAIAGAVAAPLARFAGLAARGLLTSYGISCMEGAAGLTARAAAFAIGAAEGATFGASEGFIRQGLMTGNLGQAATAGLQGAEFGGLLGGTMGAIFHQVCFVRGTQVVVAIQEEIGQQLPSGLEPLALAEGQPLYVVGKGWTPARDVRARAIRCW